MPLNEKTIQTDFCVIGGGVAGTFAAITAARLGVRTVLVHERPVFGGNAAGEIRMWVCGAQQRELREAGLQEEWELENAYFNPTKNWYLFDTLLDDMVAREKNLTALPNTTCFDADCEHTGEGGSIRSITAYQMTTQTRWKVEAAYFADCSGDSILAPLTGAHFMYGREAAGEYGEETVSSRESGDRKTMGNSLLLQARETDHKIPFIAPDFAEKVSVEKLKSKRVNLQNPSENFWYLELGGNGDVIGDAETVNRRLLSLCLGAWDTIKN